MGTLPQGTTLRAFNRSALVEADRKRLDDSELVPGLTADLESKLVTICQRQEDENYVTWRFLFRIFLEAQMFWKDQQYGYYDYRSDTYRTLSSGGGVSTQTGTKGNSNLSFQYVTNIYRAFGWTVVSVLGQKRPTVVFLPNDYTNEDDVVAARAADDVVPLLERQNDLTLQHMKACLWLYTDGICGSYTRYIIDGETFGYNKKKVVRLVPKGAGASYLCPNCGIPTPVPQPRGTEPQVQRDYGTPLQPSGTPSQIEKYGLSAPINQLPRVEGATEFNGKFPMYGQTERRTGTASASLSSPDRADLERTGATLCQNCGTPLGPEDISEGDELSLEVVGVRRIPRGQVVITVHSGLETRFPPYVQEQRDFPFISMQHEAHVSALRATYGERAKNVMGGTAGPYDTWDRFARLMLTEPHGGSYYSLANQNLVTLKEYWLRPSMFYVLEEEDRNKLLEIFPTGAYVAYEGVGMRVLDARKESMDDHWAVCRALEGPGCYTPSIGSSCISIQKRYNTLHNFIMEWVEYAAAGQGTFVNAGLVSVDALRRQRRAPGMIYPIYLPPTTPIGNAIYDSRPGVIANEVFTYGQQLVQLGQLVTGAVPTVSGGTDKSLKPTTYLTDREQALGRLYVPWQHLRNFWARTMLLAVKEFARCEGGDFNYTMQASDGSTINKTVHLDQLKGNFDAYPEVNEDFPRLLHQQQALFLSMVNSPDSTIKQLLSDPRNLPYVKTLFGWPSIYVPGEDDIMKQKREISRLIVERPIQQLSPSGQVIFLPSIMPDVYADNHPLHSAIVKAWAVSSEGIRIKDEDPLGYANAVAHGRMHDQIASQQQQQAQQAMMQQEMQKESTKIGAAQVATKRVTQQIKQAEAQQQAQQLQAAEAQASQPPQTVG